MERQLNTDKNTMLDNVTSWIFQIYLMEVLLISRRQFEK